MESIKNDNVVWSEDNLFIREGTFDSGKTKFYCGYVEIDKSQLKEKYLNNMDNTFDDDICEVEVHGGVTFIDIGKNSVIYGFDCAHYKDFEADTPYKKLDNVINETKLFRDNLLKILGK